MRGQSVSAAAYSAVAATAYPAAARHSYYASAPTSGLCPPLPGHRLRRRPGLGAGQRKRAYVCLSVAGSAWLVLVPDLAAIWWYAVCSASSSGSSHNPTASVSAASRLRSSYSPGWPACSARRRNWCSSGVCPVPSSSSCPWHGLGRVFGSRATLRRLLRTC